ncbi:MAG: putative beta-lysine N-acetyltransferase [Myxococcales bacterium]|nr:putative beta-lysine N-acetyltransferase [Myxococcales bacterium]
MSEVTAGLGALLEHSGVALLTPIAWGIGVTFLAFVAVVIAWRSSRARGWLGVASGSAWPRRLTLAIWMVLLVPTSGAAGFAYGAERATLGLLDESQVIERSCGAIASGMILVVAEEGSDRIPVAAIRGLWDGANTQVVALRDQKIREAVASQLDPGVSADAAGVVGRWGAEALQRELVGGATDAVDGILAALAAEAAADGTVGAAEAGAWLSERYVLPTVRDFLVGLMKKSGRQYNAPIERIVTAIAPTALRELADRNGFDKIIVMASHDDWQAFLRFGYVLEAVLEYFHAGADAFVVSKFRSQERLSSPALMEETLLIEKITASPAPGSPRSPLPAGHTIRLARPGDIPGLLELYSAIFESYPSPLKHASYLEQIFQRDSIFAVCVEEERVVAAASAELVPRARAAELTDCATWPEARGRGLMSHLLVRLEEELRSRDYVCAYTMARGRSYGMNSVFHVLGYEYTGRLINNCDIYGAYEDMNIWVKDLRPAPAPAKE